LWFGTQSPDKETNTRRLRCAPFNVGVQTGVTLSVLNASPNSRSYAATAAPLALMMNNLTKS
jgi:hypothetical protein